jgi:hypothetical protein
MNISNAVRWVPQFAFSLRPLPSMLGVHATLGTGPVTVSGKCGVDWKLRRLIITCSAVPAVWWWAPLFWLNRVPVVRWLFRPLIRIAHRRAEARRRAASKAAEVTDIRVVRHFSTGDQRMPLLFEKVPVEAFSELAIGASFSDDMPACKAGDSLAVTLDGSEGNFIVMALVERPEAHRGDP